MPAARKSAGAPLARLFADEWAQRLHDDPLFATAVGVHDHDDRLPAVAPADLERQARQDREFLERIALARFRDWRIPLTSDSGFHTEVLRMADGVAMPAAVMPGVLRIL